MYRGELKRRAIKNIILSSGENGATVGQIMQQLKQLKIIISRQQIHKYLKEPWAYKDGNKYFMKHAIMYDDWSALSEYINELQYFSFFRDLWQDRDFQSNFRKNSLEDMIFQFSNQVGALLSYIIIEALRPTETLKPMRNRKKLTIDFVRDALSPEYLLQTFLAILAHNFGDRYQIGPLEVVTDEYGNVVKGDYGRIKKSIIKNSSIAPEINELYINKNQNPLQDLIDAYNRVYPHLHDLIEKNFKKYIDKEEGWKSCDHIWEPIIIHKIGAGYECQICFRKISEEKYKRISRN